MLLLLYCTAENTVLFSEHVLLLKVLEYKLYEGRDFALANKEERIFFIC